MLATWAGLSLRVLMTLGMLSQVFAVFVCWLAGCRLWFWTDVLVIHQASLVHHIVGVSGFPGAAKGHGLLCKCLLSLHLRLVCYCPIGQRKSRIGVNSNIKGHWMQQRERIMTNLVIYLRLNSSL